MGILVDYEQLFECATIGLVAFNPKGEIVVVNRHATETLGYSSDDLRGSRFSHLLDGPSRRRLSRRLRTTKGPATPFDISVRTRSGESCLLSVSLNEKPLAEGLRVVAFREVTVRRQMEHELQETKSTLEMANRQLQDLDAARFRFINTAAHELRIPVTIVNGYCTLLRDMGTDNLTSQQQEFLAAAIESSDRLVDLINNMLDLSRFEAGKMPLNIDTRCLQEVVAGVCRELQPLLRESHLEFSVELPDSDCPVAFDREKIERVLVNLISNAVKYTPAGGRVRVVLCIEEGEVSVSVEDTGRGIQRERIPEIFDEFAQIGPADAGRGSGLGLSICKKIIDSHQGRIWVESAPGQGSRFTFSLPKSPSAASCLSLRTRNP